MDFEIYIYKALYRIRRIFLKVLDYSFKIFTLFLISFILHSVFFYSRGIVLGEFDSLIRVLSNLNFFTFPILNILFLVFGSVILELILLGLNETSKIEEKNFIVKQKNNKINKTFFTCFTCSCLSSKKTCQLLN